MASIAIILAAALIGALAAGRLRLPVIVGYLAAGILAGPYSLGLVQDVGLVETMASIGIVLLMFSLGMEFSVADLRLVGRAGIGAGVAQIMLSTVFGFLVGKGLFGWSSADAMFFGFMIAMSSTMIVLKILIDRGEMSAPHGRVLMAILLLQDLAVVPLMAVLPALGQGTALLTELGLALLKAAVFLGAMVAVGSWAIPALLGRAAGPRSREVFLITVLTISLGAAFSTQYFGVSQALGAFAAGMLISRSPFAHQALADMIPFRDAFAAVFFVSLGMLANPRFVFENWPTVLMVALVVIIGKFVLSAGVMRYFGYGFKAALLVGAGLAQVGEFSFVLGQSGLATGVMSSTVYSVIISAAVLTMLLTPLVVTVVDIGYRRLSASLRFSSFLALGHREEAGYLVRTISNHVVICGHGRAGSNLATILRKYDISYVVIELNPITVSSLRAQSIPCIYGDAGNPRILSLARVEKAKVLALTCPDPLAQIGAAVFARQANPSIDIIARLPDAVSGDSLKSIGVTDVVDPAFEASLEFVRHILDHYGISRPEVESIACPFLREHDIEDKDSTKTKA